jgi:hypothetical protein
MGIYETSLFCDLYGLEGVALEGVAHEVKE